MSGEKLKMCISITTVTDEEKNMITINRQPVSVGEMIKTEFMEPLNLTQDGLAKVMMVSRKTVSDLCNNQRTITVDTALILAKVFGNTPDFWLNLQKRNDIWNVMHSPARKARIDRVQPIHAQT
jgi:addiction module HigA family antidote